MSWVKDVKVMQVIRVMSTIGAGKDGDPLRPFYEFYDMDGNKLEVGDYTK